MLVSLQGALAQWVERQAARRFYPLKLLGFILLLTFAFQPTHVGTLQTYARGGSDAIPEAVRRQIAHPFTDQQYPPESHQSKMTFRLLPLVVGGFMVYDVTRSVAYAFPAAIVGAVLLRRQMNRPAFRQLAAVVWLMAALISSVYIINGRIHATNSLFDQAAQKLRVPGPPPR